MDSPACKNCTRFHQHYILDKQSCTAVNRGHCCYLRLKHRKPDTPACAHYIRREMSAELPDRPAVIYYLTTKVLEYILSLELPPEVEST